MSILNRVIYMKTITLVTATLFVFLFLIAGYVKAQERLTEKDKTIDKKVLQHIPRGAKLETTDKIVRAGKTYTRIKYLDANMKIQGLVLDPNGQPVAMAKLPEFRRASIGPQLKARLSLAPGVKGYIPPDGEVDVVVVLRMDDIDTPEPDFSGEGEVVDGEVKNFVLDGKKEELDQAEERLDATAQRLNELRQKRRRSRVLKLRELQKRQAWDKRTELTYAIKRGDTSVRLKVKRKEIDTLLKRNSDLVIAVELYTPSEDSTADALAEMRIDDWALDKCHNGGGVGIYMSESGGECPTAPHIRTDWYTNLTGAGSDNHANFVGNILRVTAPRAHIYCGPADSIVSDPSSRSPRIYVSTHSFNWYDNDTSYRSQDRDFDNSVYEDRIAVFISAGNKKSALTTYTVLTPAKAFNALTLGNYNDANDTMNSGSLYVDPDPGNEKPEIVAPGTNITSTAGTGGGTSYSTPFAAGFAADMMSQYPWLKGHPELVKALMMSGASLNIEGSVRLSDKDGAGAINYLNAAYNSHYWWWHGGNSSWFNSDDNKTVSYSLTANRRYRVVLVWLVPGSYAYSNDNVHMDLDLRVTKPDGSYMAGSSSYDNGFEIVDFTAPTTGSYSIRIHRFWNSGTGNVLMGLVVNRIL